MPAGPIAEEPTAETKTDRRNHRSDRRGHASFYYHSS